MERRGRQSLEAWGIVLVASDPLVIAAAHDAARRLRGPSPVQILTGSEALHRLLGPGRPPRHLVLDGGAAGGPLLSAARDRFSATQVIVVTRPGETGPAGLRAVPAEGGRLAEALAASPAVQPRRAADATTFAAGLARGEITVRFQPVVRLPDRRPVLVEALARWERPEAALPAGAFINVAQRAGLAVELTLAVARRALEELARVGRQPRLRLSLNVPLGVLLRGDLASRLRAILAARGFPPSDLLLELTECTTVRDTALLRRALERVGAAGFGVLLDDLVLDDRRHGLLDLPFAGAKIDRALIAALPHSRRARAQVERLVQAAHRQGRPVIAEGVTDPLLWRAAAATGCDLAQGFGVGRPIPPETLPAWMAAWRAAGLPGRQLP